MNVCCICQGDGVLYTANQWYCVDHIDEAFIVTAQFVARVLGHDDQEAKMKAQDWVKEL